MSTEPQGNLRLLQDPDFKDLVSRKNRISIILTVVTLLIYGGFIGLVAFKPKAFGAQVGGGITFGIVLGIGVIIACWVLTGIYVRWANQNYDAMVARLKEKAGHGGT